MEMNKYLIPPGMSEDSGIKETTQQYSDQVPSINRSSMYQHEDLWHSSQFPSQPQFFLLLLKTQIKANQEQSNKKHSPWKHFWVQPNFR